MVKAIFLGKLLTWSWEFKQIISINIIDQIANKSDANSEVTNIELANIIRKQIP